MAILSTSCKTRFIVDNDLDHCLYMQLNGVFVPELVKHYNASTLKKGYYEIHLRLPPNEMNGDYSVPKKLPVVPEEQTPYTFSDNRIFFFGNEIFDGKPVFEVPLDESRSPRYLKGYSFPLFGTNNPFYELRINPKNTGRCPGRCLFCHRMYSYREKPPETIAIISPSEIVQSILKYHSKEVLKKISHVSIITELFGNEDTYVSYLYDLKDQLICNGCSKDIKFNACAQDVRTINGLERLYNIVNPARYSYTLEVFENRENILGQYKGISMPEVYDLLNRARSVGFKEIKINYVAGIDSIDSFYLGIKTLRKMNIVDSIGLSILTVFFQDQYKIRNNEAWNKGYYIEILNILKSFNVDIYEPKCFEMGYPINML